MNLLAPATDWTNQTNEERAEACAAFLFTFRFLGTADHYRTQNQIRARANTQREERAKGTSMADRTTKRTDRDCNMCDDTGYKDYAGFAMDPCDHSQPCSPCPSEIARRVMSDALGVPFEECSDMSMGAQYIREGIRRYAEALIPTPAEDRFDHEHLTYAGMMAALRAVAKTGVMETLDLTIFRGYVHGQDEERAKRDAMETADRLARRMGGRFVARAAEPAGEEPVARYNNPEVDELSYVLLQAFKRAEPNNGITHYPASYMATFADMAHAAICARPSLRPAPSNPDRLVEALRDFGTDYMTREAHHPGYVLIPTEQFNRICAALSAPALDGEKGE